jgi:hypothetical protein
MTALTIFIKIPEVRDLLKSIHPIFKRSIKQDLVCGINGDRPSLVGTAFDYLLRIKIKKLIPSSDLNLIGLNLVVLNELYRNMYRYLVKNWSREDCEKYDWFTDVENTDGCDKKTIKHCRNLHFDLSNLHYHNCFLNDSYIKHDKDGLYIISLKKLADRMISVQAESSANINYYLQSKEDEEKIINNAISASLKLSFIESVNRRSCTIPPDFFAADLFNEKEDLSQMINIVPPFFYDYDHSVLLNPVLTSSKLQINADCDIIKGGNLIDIKTVSNPSISIYQLNQLLGYFILARLKRQTNKDFPEIKEVSIYFSRYGYLWSMNVNQWLDNNDFAMVEKKFIEYRTKEIEKIKKCISSHVKYL